MGHDKLMPWEESAVKELAEKGYSMEYSHFDYRVTFNGEFVGAAGTLTKGRRLPSNLEHFRRLAYITARDHNSRGE